jgi:hypothetical protein
MSAILSEVVDSFAEEGESSWQPGGGPMHEEPFTAPGPPSAPGPNTKDFRCS